MVSTAPYSITKMFSQKSISIHVRTTSTWLSLVSSRILTVAERLADAICNSQTSGTTANDDKIIGFPQLRDLSLGVSPGGSSADKSKGIEKEEDDR